MLGVRALEVIDAATGRSVSISNECLKRACPRILATEAKTTHDPAEGNAGDQVDDGDGTGHRNAGRGARLERAG